MTSTNTVNFTDSYVPPHIQPAGLPVRECGFGLSESHFHGLVILAYRVSDRSHCCAGDCPIETLVFDFQKTSATFFVTYLNVKLP